MKHFLVYHNEDTVGIAEGSDAAAHTEKNLGVEKGDKIWLIVGHKSTKKDKRKHFSLWKTFLVESVNRVESESFRNRYSGTHAVKIDAALNDFEWFETFKKNVWGPGKYDSREIKDNSVITQLEILAQKAHR